VLFALMVYSYFITGRRPPRSLGCLALLWFAAAPRRWRRAVEPFALMSLCAVVSLVPYFLLLSRRAPTMDTVQALTYSRAPDLWRGVILLAALVLVALAFGARKRWLNARGRRVLFTAALALSVLVVFNQQIITGRSLQPMHYEQYIGNYVALWRPRSRRACSGRGVKLFKAAGGATRELRRRRRRRPVPHRIWLTVALGALLWGRARL
jgi:hypothetical protein